MQTAIPSALMSSPEIQEAEKILRACVHCGFCNATCPTYQTLGDELDGPRGRIYLIKQMLEGNAVSRRTLTHLDRCLTCRNCETTCPSGVRYGRLLDVGRELAEERVGRPLHQRLVRWLLCQVIPYRARFGFLLRLARRFRPLLPPALKRKLLARRDEGARPSRLHKRQMILLEGCVQPELAPEINAACARVLDRLGIQAVTLQGETCCGAAQHHTSSVEAGLDSARKNIDALWPHVEAGIEAIVSSASGCGVHLKEYGHLLRHDQAYATKAQRVAALVR
ncbi:MAG: glycolate oxidase subunit GlcF, partial [Gammaproteobacteria bacterium]|nr:glycolate oxidase subunit GlcF [Gammaproteobacteria bacterium]